MVETASNVRQGGQFARNVCIVQSPPWTCHTHVFRLQRANSLCMIQHWSTSCSAYASTSLSRSLTRCATVHAFLRPGLLVHLFGRKVCRKRDHCPCNSGMRNFVDQLNPADLFAPSAPLARAPVYQQPRNVFSNLSWRSQCPPDECRPRLGVVQFNASTQFSPSEPTVAT